jgi:hypothetical protein
LKVIYIWWLTLAVGIASAQTTGSGNEVLQTAATINPLSVDQVLYADQFAGSDIGQKVNNAIKACLPTAAPQCEIRLAAGTYTLATTITVTAPGISIVGAGMAGTVLNYTGTTQAITINTAASSGTATSGGHFGGFTIQGNPHASGTAIQVTNTVGARFEDIHIYAFDQANAIGMQFVVSGSSSQVERNQVSHVIIEYATTAIQFTTIPVAKGPSFGYNRFSDVAISVEQGQVGVDAIAGTFYNGTLTMTCNVNTTATVVLGCLVIEPTANWVNNVYQITGEGPAIPQLLGIHVKSGGALAGFGVANILNATMQNDNSAGYTPTFRILPGTSATTTVLDGGTMSNFLGTGATATVYPQLASLGGYANFGFLGGTNIISPYVAMYNSQPNNAFMIYSYGYRTAPNQMTALARFDGAGNLHVLGAVYAGGADYAESMKAKHDTRAYEAGDVMAVSIDHAGELELASTPYSTRVAGIYSTRPGILGGVHGVEKDPKGEVPLAIHGIVPCKVSAENGSILPGDLLVSASIPGFAMKGTQRDAMLGAVVGKSLSRLISGTATIPVLVTLQ